MRDFSAFFIDRPIFAAVLSILLFVVGLIAIPLLPVAEYPDVVPPSVQVRAVYPGANPKVIAETVATPLEEAMNGVEHMMYMKSVAGSDGVMYLTVTFTPGTEVDLAQVQVQNRVNQALPRLPEDVRRLGVTTEKQSPNLTMVVHLLSPNQKYDTLYLRNYATLHVKDELARLPGVGQAMVFGGGDYSMRIWLDPDKVAARDMAAGDVTRAIREQNVQVSAGTIGGPPQPRISDFTLSINAQGRLVTEDEFGDIVVKTGAGGEITRLRDVARIELGASEYALRSLLNNQQAVAVAIFQAPGSNAIALSDSVRAKMRELERFFPEGVTWDVVYDPTVFVRDSIKAVVQTLFEAVFLVVVVVILFLQTWRASIIPLLAVPVSIVSTFAVLLLFGFSINTLTLFGLVLAIGIVVDDAIVVVENVERNIANGLAPRAAAHQAMREVSGPIIAIALVLTAVFVPMSFLSGVTGQFYRQFAVAIAISTVISAINSLTLSPALAATLLKRHGAAPDAATRVLNTLFGWLFRPFNRGFLHSAEAYAGVVVGILRRSGRILVLYGGLIGLTWLSFQAVPGGFIPTQDKLYLIGGVKLPEGASLDRTEAVVRTMSEMALSTEGVHDAVAFPGLNALQFSNTPNVGTIFFGLEGFDQRQRPAPDIVGELMGKFSSIQEAFAFAIMPPPILGLGTGSGFSLYVQDRAGLGYGELQHAVHGLAGALSAVPGMGFPISSYQANVPQLTVDVDRTKAKRHGLSLNEVFETLQIYLGSSYVNDFNRFGRTYQVYAQADARFRDQPEDVLSLRARNQAGEMVPIGSIVAVGQTYGPDPVIRYNGYPAADLIGEADPRIMSSNEVIATIAALAPRVLPAGTSFDWTDLSYQQVHEGNANKVVFPLCVLLVFLVLAALYESWTLPLAVILIVPMCLLSALFGVWLTGGDNNIFVQIGLVVLMGLACKNAILIVEFARELEHQGRGAVAAAIEASRLRLRPIVMTSVAFIAGVVPLVFSHGAGAEVRRIMGITVFSGMLGVTVFGLFMTPVFYVVIRAKLARRRERGPGPAPALMDELARVSDD
ncbi:OqxB integral membrane protein [Methylocaldum marinum]|uniref:Efflux pump membrane transporter n=1 Tax=Methylocaldum marinum TaxID=1432792 RepID=A0A250KMX7_9GAMM|nr:multidrug efflux RND transporter permease subunit [Methylocaldum marinum]BBA32896.1 OqxB integral membrane protein [Methylocaldum marinum]